MDLRFYGSIKTRVRDADLSGIDRRCPVPLAELMRQLQLPDDSISMVMINHRAVTQDSFVGPGDRVAFFPREYPFFADWNDYRQEPDG